MPKVSMSSKDAEQVSLGIQEGNIEVVDARTTVMQYPPNKKTGKQSSPFLCHQLDVKRLDSNWARVQLDGEDDDTVKIEFSFGRSAYNTSCGEGDQLCNFHVGKASGPDDEEPEDLGHELGTEGNCIVQVKDGAKLNNKCKAIIFNESLERQGFKPEILGRGYSPDLIGLKCHVKTIKSTFTDDDGKDTEYGTLVVDKIQPPLPYEKKSGGKKAPATATKGKSTDTTPSTPTPPDEPETNSPAEELAIKLLDAVAKEHTGKEDVPRKQIQTDIQTRLIRQKHPTKLHKPVMDLIKDAEWLRGQSEEFTIADDRVGFIVADDEESVTFA